MEPIIIRNRKITTQDLPVIQAVVNEHWERGRTHISRELCKYWNWVQPSGRFKDMTCRELLLTLHRKGLFDYPPSRFTPKNVGRTTARIHVGQTPINCTLKELSPVRVEMVRYTGHEPIYNSLVDQFHYLGYSQIVGVLFHFVWVSHYYYLIDTLGFTTLKFKSPVTKKTTTLKYRNGSFPFRVCKYCFS